jgi:gliding motility-associated-like protein
MKKISFLYIALILQVLMFSQSKQFCLSDDVFGSRGFVQNNGQFNFIDEKKPKILYKYDHKGECIYFTDKGLIYKQTEIVRYSHRQIELFEEDRKKLDNPKEYFIFMNWNNSNNNIKVVPSQEQTNYFSYGDKKFKSSVFKKITYQNVYNNIDIEYVIPENRSEGIKYNVILNPGADVNDIRISYSGDLSQIFINKSGEIIIKGKVNDIKEHLPVSYFKNNIELNVPCRFNLVDNLISFIFESKLELNRTLVIDPWVSTISTFSANNYAYDVDYDYAGNLYVHGGTAPFKVAKYNSSGILLWTFAGTVVSQSWTSTGDYPPKPLVGNFLVQKISQKCYIGQGWQSNGSRIVRIDANGIYDNFITTANVPMKECWDMAFNCNTNDVITMGGHEGTNSSGGVIDQSTGTLVPTTFYPANIGSGHDVVSGAIDESGVLYVIYASAQTSFMNNKIIRVNSSYNNNVWMVPSSYNSFAENDNKASYVGSGLGLGSSNGFNCLGVNNNYLFYYDGLNLAVYSKSTGALLSSISIAGQIIKSQGGIAIDDCNNIYLGGNGLIVCYNFNGTSFTALSSISLGITIPNKYVYDLKLDKSSNLLYVCGSGFAGVYSAINSYSCSNQLSISSVCLGSNTAAASATLTTSVMSPIVSYTWTNSSGTVVSQTNNSSSLTNSITGITNGSYILYSQINPPCGTINTQTVNINCSPTSTSICSGTLGTPVFFEDFGSGASLYGPVLPPGVTNYTYLQGIPNNGTYVIASSSNPSGTNAGYVNDNHDHTGNTNGYMMVVNSDYPASEVYRKHVTGLCQNTTYVFSAYLANNNSPDAVTNVCGASYVYANIKFQTEFPVGTVLNSTTSGNLAVASNSVSLPWIQYGFAFTTGPGQTSADVVLVNNAPGGCGNDYVVDDISLAPCGPGVSLSIVPNNTVFCPGSSVVLQSTFTSGSYIMPQYQWQYSGDGGLTWGDISGATSSNYNISSVTSTQGGMYQLLVSENGSITSPSCRIAAGPLSFSVANTVSLSTVSPTICAGNSAILVANGASTYTWSNNSNLNSITVSPSSTTVYSVTGTIGTCTSQAVATVSVIPSATISITGNTVICSGQSATLTASGYSNYVWNSGLTTNPNIVSPIVSTNYSVSALIGVCSNTAVTTVSVLANPILTLSPNVSICQGVSSTVTLTASGATTYTWANSSTLSSSTGSAVIASLNTTTNYTVTGANAACTNTAIVTVNVQPSPTITAVSFTNTTCGLSNGAVSVTSLPSNNTYTWSSGVSSTTNTASNLATGDYTITANNGACNTNTVVSIFSSVPLSITSSIVLPSNCNLNDGSISVNDNMIGSNYSWSPNVSTTNNANGLATGNYALTIINGACTTSTVFNVGSVGGPLGFISITAPSCDSEDGSIVIDSIKGGVKPYSMNFNNNGLTSNLIFENLSTGNYSLSIRDSSLCETEYVLTVPDNKTDFTLYIPNTFTPNNDKINDVWYIKGVCLEKMKCSIYNRWGEKIKELRDISEGWDGTYKGASVSDGIYVYLIEVSTKEGTVNKVGHITIFR